MVEDIFIFLLKVLWGLIYVGFLVTPLYLIGAFAYALWLDHKHGKKKEQIRGTFKKEAN